MLLLLNKQLKLRCVMIKKYLFRDTCFCLLLLISLIFSVAQADVKSISMAIDKSDYTVEYDNNINLPKEGKEIEISNEELLTSGLLLVNKVYPQPENFEDNTLQALVNINKQSNGAILCFDDNQRLFPKAYSALEEALRAALDAGNEGYMVMETFRSYDKQTELFLKMKTNLSEDFKEYSLLLETQKRTNIPGTSEYQTGLSFRIDIEKIIDPPIFFNESPQGKWFAQNCYKYGIVFRFPTNGYPLETTTDKSVITGNTMQLSIYRYVGKAHALAMKIFDLSLEEYISFLKNNPHLMIYKDNEMLYEIFRFDSEDSNIKIYSPNNAIDYQASFDNVGGIVVAYSYK